MEPQRTFTPHGAPIRDAKLLPVQPPAKIIGRNRELGSMHVTLKIGSSVFLSGVPGIGKSALASVLATAYIASNPGGVLWFNVVEDDLDLLIARTGRAYGVNALASNSEATDITDNATMVRALLEKNHPLIVLDGLIDVDAARDYVRQCATGVPVILLNELAGAGPWTPIELGPLAQEDSIALFKQCSNLSDALYEPDIVGLSKFLGGIPLAIELAGLQVITDDLMPAELLTALPSSTGQDSQLMMMAVVFKRLPPPVQAMLLVLSAMFTGSATAELISDLSDVPAQNIIPLMRQLVARGLARESVVYGQFAYTLHEVAQNYARDWLEQYQRLTGTENRALLAVIKYTERHAHPQPVHHDRLSAEMENIVGAAAYATETNQSGLFRRLHQAVTQRAGDFVALRGFQPEMNELMKLATLIGPGTGPLGTPPATSPTTAASATQAKRKTATQETQTSTPPTVSEPVPANETQVMTPVADSTIQSSPAAPAPPPEPPTVAAQQPAPPEMDTQSVTSVQEKRKTQPTIEEPPLDSEMTPTLRRIPRPPLPPDTRLQEDTQFREAPLIEPPHSLDETQPGGIEYLLATRKAQTDITDIAPPTATSASNQATQNTAPSVSAALPSADVSNAIPEPPKSPEDTDLPTDMSLPTLQKQLDDAKASGDTTTQARLLHTLGQYYAEQGDRAQAQTYHKQALEAYESLDDLDGMLVTLDALAALAAWADDAQNALVYASRGVNIAQRLGDNSRMGRLQSRLGDVRLALNDLPGAIEAYTQAVQTLRVTEDWLTIGVAMSKLGGVYLEQHKPKEAIMMLEQALVMFQKEDRTDNAADVLAKLGSAYGEMQQWDRAQSYYEQALVMARQNEDAGAEALDLGALARARKLQADRAGAVDYYRQALHVAYQIDDTDLQAEYAFELGNLLSDDMTMLNLALQLLRESDAQVPNGDARRMVERTRKRLERATAAGVSVPAASVSSQDYAAEAYMAHVS